MHKVDNLTHNKGTRNMVTFASLKRNSKDKFKKLTEKLAENSGGKRTFGDSDENTWKPTLDKASNGFAVIRFLDAPQVDGEDGLPWVRIFDHGFQGPGGWFIENCPTTLNEACPLCQSNSNMWNSGVEANKNIARDRKRRLHYYSNIMVVKDPANPDNEGKVFRFKYGKKIYDKINEMAIPSEDPIDPKEPINVFDFWTGANFKLKVRKVEGFISYDKSEFDTPSPILGGNDAEIESLWKTLPSLKEIVAPEKFKAFAELENRMNRVLGGAVNTSTAEEDSDTASLPVKEAPAASKTKKPAKQPVVEEPADDEGETGVDDDSLDFFAKLAAEDED